MFMLKIMFLSFIIITDIVFIVHIIKNKKDRKKDER